MINSHPRRTGAGPEALPPGRTPTAGTDRPRPTAEHGILFSAPLVRALLAGKKSQTRRKIALPDDYPPSDLESPVRYSHPANTWALDLTRTRQMDDARRTRSAASGTPCVMVRCPHPVGTRLWVRETWATERRFDRRKPRKLPKDARIHYLADGPKPAWAGRTRPSLVMPRWASRISLVVTDVRVVRAQEISDADIAAEGMDAEAVRALWEDATNRRRREAGGLVLTRPRDLWRIGWTLINGRESWDADPWCWAYTFRSADGAGEKR